MCNFLSAIILRNGDVLTHPLLDSHSGLVTYFALPDDRPHHQHFAKVELTPQDWLDVDTWTFRLDEATAPGWWDDVKGQAEATLRDRAKAMILTTGRKELILEGCWILAGDVEVLSMRGGRIPYMAGGTVQVIWGGTVQVIWGGTVQAIWDGTVQAIRGGTVPKPGIYAVLSDQAKAFIAATFPEPKPSKPKRLKNKPARSTKKQAVRRG